MPFFFFVEERARFSLPFVSWLSIRDRECSRAFHLGKGEEKKTKRNHLTLTKLFFASSVSSLCSPTPPRKPPSQLPRSLPAKTMFFAAEPRHCDLELLVPYLAAMSHAKSSCAMPASSMMAKAGQRCAASSAAAAAPAPARYRQQPAPAQPQKQKQRENQFEGGAASPSSPQRPAPPRPGIEKKNVQEASGLGASSSPRSAVSAGATVFHHLPPSASNSGAHLFSVDLPGRSLSSFDIDVVEEKHGAGRLFIDAAEIECGAESRNFFVPRKRLSLSLDLPRDADLSRVSADYDAGVLLVRVPLARREEIPKRFKVVVGGGGGGGGRKGKAEKEAAAAVEEEAAGKEAEEASASPSPSASLGAVAAADLSRAAPLGENANDDEDGSWKAVSSDDEDEGEEEGGRKPSGPGSSSSPSTTRKTGDRRKVPSGGAVLEAIEDDDAQA